MYRLGISGEAGSFSEEAASLYQHRAGRLFEFVYLTDMEGVLAAVENQEVTQGIFPVVNMRGGLVQMAFEAMGRHRFVPIDELWLDVHQCLLVPPGMCLGDITQVISHAQALAQCHRYLQQHLPHAACREWADTAKAARELAEGRFDVGTAVIAPERSAALHGLTVLGKNIQDNHPNLTAFIIVESLQT